MNTEEIIGKKLGEWEFSLPSILNTHVVGPSIPGIIDSKKIDYLDGKKFPRNVFNYFKQLEPGDYSIDFYETIKDPNASCGEYWKEIRSLTQKFAQEKDSALPVVGKSKNEVPVCVFSLDTNEPEIYGWKLGSPAVSVRLIYDVSSDSHSVPQVQGWGYKDLDHLRYCLLVFNKK
jgi:hypothetical protein